MPLRRREKPIAQRLGADSVARSRQHAGDRKQRAPQCAGQAENALLPDTSRQAVGEPFCTGRAVSTRGAAPRLLVTQQQVQAVTGFQPCLSP